MHSKKLIITAQVFISGMMAFLMTGFFAFVYNGFHAETVSLWMETFVRGWPVAFIFSLFVSPLAFFFAGKIVKE